MKRSLKCNIRFETHVRKLLHCVTWIANSSVAQARFCCCCCCWSWAWNCIQLCVYLFQIKQREEKEVVEIHALRLDLFHALFLESETFFFLSSKLTCSWLRFKIYATPLVSHHKNQQIHKKCTPTLTSSTPFADNTRQERKKHTKNCCFEAHIKKI